jgi:hypothetical protein
MPIAPRRVAAVAAVVVSACVWVPHAQAACPPPPESAALVQALWATEWRFPDSVAEPDRQALALGLLDCLASPDPVWRDERAFEALSAWMRGKVIAVPTLQTMRKRLVEVLEAPADAAGFHQPFAALVLAEVARVDRLQPLLSADERAALVQSGTRYLTGVRDYRGYDAKQGWRHGVAHGADLMLQLSLNPQLTKAQGEALRTAIAGQVLAHGGHAYRYGESERLMAPLYHLARRDWWTAADWELWFVALDKRRVKDVPPTDAGLAQRHNIGVFLSTFYVSVQESPDAAQRDRVLPGLRLALQALR